MVKCIEPSTVQTSGIDCYKRYCSKKYPQVYLELFISERCRNLTCEYKVKNVEIYSKKHHEYGNNALEIVAVICGYACILYRKSACSCCCEGVDYAVKNRHPPRYQHHDLNECKHHIYSIEQLCTLLKLWNELVHDWPRAFCSEKMQGMSLSFCKRYYGKQKYKHSHSSKPVSEASPVKKTHVKSLYVCEYARSRSSKP